MYKFDRVESLAEMKEICFFIKAINSGINNKKFNKKNLMIFKSFLKSEYNLETPLSKLYLFVEKIEYINNGKIPSDKQVDKIVKAYLDFSKKTLSEYKKEIIKAELNIKDPKYNLGDYGYKSSKELTTDISVTRKLYYGYNNWFLIASLAMALLLTSGLVVLIGAFFPNLLVGFESKRQELIVFFMILAVLAYSTYYVLDFLYRKKTWHLKAKIDGYNKYIVEIEKDYGKLIEAKERYSKKLADVSINGIEFSEKLLYNYLTLNDNLDIQAFSGFNIKMVKLDDKEDDKKIKKIGVVLSKNEQILNWQKSAISKIEKQNINKELVARVDNLASILKQRNVSTINLAKSISELYCNDLSVEKRKSRIDNAESKYELTKNYLLTLGKIEEYEKLSFFEKSKGETKRELQLEKLEIASFNEDLSVICDRIEKAYSLKLIEEAKYKSYKIIKDALDKKFIYGINILDVKFRSELAKLYIRIYEELALYDVLN